MCEPQGRRGGQLGKREASCCGQEASCPNPLFSRRWQLGEGGLRETPSPTPRVDPLEIPVCSAQMRMDDLPGCGWQPSMAASLPLNGATQDAEDPALPIPGMVWEARKENKTSVHEQPFLLFHAERN